MVEMSTPRPSRIQLKPSPIVNLVERIYLNVLSGNEIKTDTFMGIMYK